MALDADVLALFGAEDSNVDCRRTRALCDRTIGANPDATLTMRTSPNGNHNIHRAATGGLKAMEAMRERTPGEG